jgi:serine/threonine protein kinase
MAVPSIIPRGTLLGGKYRIDREIGRGGMAAVYEAENVNINKRVAIKLLAGHLTASQTVVERFLREARAVSAIKSPHICEVYDSGRLDDNTPFLVLELLEGESLYDAMCRDRQMSPAVTLSIVLQAAKGLAKAHDAGIVHRDLKPENIFLTVDGDGHLLVKVLDFGLAKFYDPVHTTGKGGKAARLTREGAVFGTPAYMSPEQVRGQAAADTRADLWALACITYECFTGTTVWSTEDGVAMTFAQIATAPPPDARKYRPDLPMSFNDWFNKALDRDINVRFQTVHEFADALVAAFAYDAQRGGLDGALITQITNEAAHAPDSETITARARAVAERRVRASPHASVPSSSSKPIVQMLSQSPSSLELPAPQQNLLVPTMPPPRRKTGKILGGVLVLLLVVGGVVVFTSLDNQRPPQEAKRFATAARRHLGSGPTQVSGFEYVAKHPWLPLVREAQALVAQGEHDRALSILRRVYEQHRHGMIRNMMDQLGVAVQGRAGGARCEVNGLARPRRYDLLSQDRKAINAGPPTIVRGLSSAVMTWTDNRDGQKRAYAVPLDDALRNRKLPIDITPEGAKVFTPTLLPFAQRFLAVYWDAQGAAAGVYIRWLDNNAVIAGPPSLVSEQKSMAFFAKAARHGDGFVVAWIDQVDADAMDVFFRLFDKDGKPTDEAVRVTDYVHYGSSPTRLRDLQVAARGDQIFFTYLSVRGGNQQIRFLTVPADTKSPGLEKLEKGKAAKERVLGNEVRVSPRTQKPGLPSLGCVKDGCFIAWYLTTRGGGGVAFIDGKSGKRVWHKKFTQSGKRPALSVSPAGDVRMVWTRGGRIITATVGREGVGPSSKVARVVGEHSPPSIAAGMKKNEWYVSWLDFESGHREPYAVRMVCQ